MDRHSQDTGNRARTFGRWIFCSFLLIGGFFLITEHRAHLFGILPYLLFLLCPLMHLFHHHGGHGHGGHVVHDRSNDQDREVDSNSDAGVESRKSGHDHCH